MALDINKLGDYWENIPDQTTPLNKTNLNKVNSKIDEVIDTAVAEEYVDVGLETLKQKIIARNPKVLWEQPNINAEFAPQTITLRNDITKEYNDPINETVDYDCLECFYVNYDSTASFGGMVESVKYPKGTGRGFNLTSTIYATGGAIHYGNRTAIRMSDKQFTFSTGKGIASTSPSAVITDNTWIIPFLIVGYKN